MPRPSCSLIKDTADSGKMAYDQMIGDGNAEGNKMVQDAIDGLVAQTRAVEGGRRASRSARSRSKARTASTIRPAVQ